ncbi:hypothetical protein CEXT_585311 [Caerostris extrusa]|uniref:Uncharacterized protein n=1 Tax=Caerostris extrusa TaxID=172846 RepID=A0AAV4RJD1_CAEEX|nr:hypothetical protein CEXT_585311 [Caerostris extrusa]
MAGDLQSPDFNGRKSLAISLSKGQFLRVIEGLPDVHQQGGHSSCLDPENSKILNIAQLPVEGLSNPSPCFSSKLPAHWLQMKSYYHPYTISGSPWKNTGTKYRPTMPKDATGSTIAAKTVF